MKETHVEPESPLKLTVTCTAPGFGVICPDRVTELPRVNELEDIVNEIALVARKSAVNVWGEFIDTEYDAALPTFVPSKFQ
jgi:hypothetical protein